ncbi:protein kinase [bacterium]|nr:protein kinase [bacterium]
MSEDFQEKEEKTIIEADKTRLFEGESESEGGGKGADATASLGLPERYEVLDKIARGGMGAVYQARDKENGMTVAVKIMAQDLLQESAARKRFEQEAAHLSSLDHPYIVSVYNSGTTTQGAPYLVMELGKGKTLDEILKERGSLTPEKTVNLFMEILSGLEYAHKNGILHRDLKPSNIIVENIDEAYPSVKILDFGIMKLLDEDGSKTAAITATSAMVGTPAYMSPEQCLGEEVSQQSDIYSIGCMIFEALTGKPPFEAANAVALAMKHQSKKPPSLGGKLKKDPTARQLEAVIRSCLEKVPAFRYRDSRDLIEDLDNISSGKKIKPRKQIGDPRPYKGQLLIAVTLVNYFFTVNTLLFAPDVNKVAAFTDSALGVGGFTFLLFNLLGLVMLPFALKKLWRFSLSKNAVLCDHLDTFAYTSFYTAILTGSINSIFVIIRAATLHFASDNAMIEILKFTGDIYYPVTVVATIFTVIFFGAEISIRAWNRIKGLQPASISINTALKKSLLPLLVAATVGLVGMFVLPGFGAGVLRGIATAGVEFGPRISIASFEAARNIGGPWPEYWVDLAKAKTVQDGIEGGIKTLTSGLKENSTSVKARYERAQCFLANKQLDQALADVDSLLRSHPNEYVYHYLRGEINLGRENYPAALDDFTNALRYLRTGHCLETRGLLQAKVNRNYDLALKDLNESIEQSANSQNLARAGLITELSGDKEKARDFYKKALNKHDIYFNKLENFLNRRLGKIDRAENVTNDTDPDRKILADSLMENIPLVDRGSLMEDELLTPLDPQR